MITQCVCTSFRAQLMLGVHDMRPSAQSGADVFKLALYTSEANLNADTTAYTTDGEVVGDGYVAGGLPLTNLGVTAVSESGNGGSPTYSGVAFCDFTDLTFSGVTVTARGALIYNSTPSANANDDTPLTNPAVAVLDFGADKSVTAGDLTITFPANNASNAIVRIT